jgi:predicted metal-dependent hydrolase
MARAPMRNQPLLTEPELTARLDEFRRAVDQYNDGYWFESHETLEDLWMVTPWPQRVFFQAVIQLAAAFVHYARGEYPGILKLLDAAREKLEEYRPAYLGVDTEALARDIERARDAFVALGEERFRQFNESLVPRVREASGRATVAT